MLFGLTDNAPDMDTILDWAAGNGFSWVACQCFDDTTLIEQTQMPTWRDAILSRDMHFGVWGVHHTDPSGDASRADSQVKLWGAEFYIANAEADYKVDSGGVRGRAATFCTAFRAAQPDLPAAFCSYGAISNDNDYLGLVTDANAGQMDWKAWFDAGFHTLPQAYASDGIQLPHRCVQLYRRGGWPYDKIHLVVGIFTGGETFSGADYATMLADQVNTEWEANVRAALPVAFWKMQDGSGNPRDSSNFAVDMTSVVGTPDYVYDEPLDHCHSIRCVGGEKLIRTPHVTAAVNNVSIEALVRVEAVGANSQIIFFNGNSGLNGYGLLVNVDGTFQGLLANVAFLSASTAVLDTNYHYLVLVRDAGTWKYYLDGSIETANAGTGAPVAPSGTFQVGDGSVQLATAMVAVYGRALGAQEIADRWATRVGNVIAQLGSAFGFSLFLGETGGVLGTITEQDYIDLGGAIDSGRAAQNPLAIGPVLLSHSPANRQEW
jgi:hypothetical protein